MTTWEAVVSSVVVATVEATDEYDARHKARGHILAQHYTDEFDLLRSWMYQGETVRRADGQSTDRDRFRELVAEYEREGYERYDAIRQAREDFARSGQ